MRSFKVYAWQSHQAQKHLVACDNDEDRTNHDENEFILDNYLLVFFLTNVFLSLSLLVSGEKEKSNKQTMAYVRLLMTITLKMAYNAQ